MEPTRKFLIDMYLDYRNNYLTVEKFAEHNGLWVAHAEMLLTIAREVFDTKHPEE
jgi:hypothetical protein